MVTFCIVACISIVLLLILWMARGAPGLLRQGHACPVDTAAFYTLLSREDDEYLRSGLQPANYRRVRRERLRAAQEYLIWIAEDCSRLLTALASLPVDVQAMSSGDLRRMTDRAIKLRMLCLGCWAALWLEYLFPSFKLRPARALTSYENLRRSADVYLRTREVPITLA